MLYICLANGDNTEWKMHIAAMGTPSQDSMDKDGDDKFVNYRPNCFSPPKIYILSKIAYLKSFNAFCFFFTTDTRMRFVILCV